MSDLSDEVHYRAYCGQGDFNGESHDDWTVAQADADAHKAASMHDDVYVQQYTGDIA